MFNSSGNQLLKFNLEQGKQIIEYNNEMKEIVNPQLHLIERGSRIESMTTAHNLSQHDRKELVEVRNIENMFNNTLAEYTQTYQLFSQDILNKSQTKKRVVDYLGKVISDEDGNNYYVNNFGYTHKYSPNAWENNNSSCPSTTVSFTGKLDDLEIALPMNSGQPCKLAGKNIKNIDTLEEAWVDIKGIKHPYTQDNKSDTCSENPIEISALDYNLIPTGASMRTTDSCVSLDVNPILWNKLDNLNKKLKSQAKLLAKEIGNLKLQNEDASMELNKKKDQLLNYINDISDERQNILLNNQQLMDLNGIEYDSILQVNSNYYIYLIWIIIMIFILVVTINFTNFTINNVSPLIYILIAIPIIWILFYLFRKINTDYYKLPNINITYI